jgi:3-isopropylmalate/(R)-2-methylmalate dehydratase large subunit
MQSDNGADYTETIIVDCAAMRPMLAAPGDHCNGLGVADLTQPVNIQIVYWGSCTAGKRADFDQYYAVLAWALSQGLHVPKDASLILQLYRSYINNHL